jgi:hypothetical protein
MVDIEKIKSEWHLTDTNDEALGHYGKFIFAELCKGETIEVIAYGIWVDQEVCFAHGEKVHERVTTPFEAAFDERYLNETKVGQREKQYLAQKQKEMN